jgi:hypothetical protein
MAQFMLYFLLAGVEKMKVIHLMIEPVKVEIDEGSRSNRHREKPGSDR